MPYTVKDILDPLFADALPLMEHLMDKHGGQFTNQQFIRALAQSQQALYIDLLQRCKQHPDASPFNAAHQHMGNKLKDVAIKAGYDGPFEEGRTESDIFGNPTERKVYRRRQEG